MSSIALICQKLLQVDIGKIHALCALYEALIIESSAIEKTTADKLRLKNFLCQTFVFSALWSLGGNVSESGKDGIDVCFREIFDDHPDARCDLCGLNSAFPCSDLHLLQVDDT